MKISLAAPFLALSLAGRALAWGPDIAVTTNEGSKEATGAPSMVATSSQGLFMVRDNGTNDCFDIMRSRNGGLSWYQFFWYCGGSSTIRGHEASIVVPEKSQDFMYVAFTEGPTEIRLLKVDLANPSSWSYQTIASIPAQASASLRTPKIISDNHDFTGYYLHVSYVKSSYVNGSLSHQAALQVSTSKGTSWGTPQYFSSTGAPTSSAQCDIAYGHFKLYLTYTDSSGAYVVISTDYGHTWRNLMPLMLAPTGSRFAWPRPRIAAIQDGNAAVVVFSPPDVSGYQTGMWYAYTPDGGSSWGGGRLTTTAPNDIPSELTVDPSLGSFHLVYMTTETCSGELCYDLSVNYTSAPYATPWLWSAPVRINDAWRYESYPTIAVDWASKQPGIGWRDVYPSRILFDRRDR